MSQKTQPGSVESRVHDLKRTEFENILIKKLGEMFDYGNVSKLVTHKLQYSRNVKVNLCENKTVKNLFF